MNVSVSRAAGNTYRLSLTISVHMLQLVFTACCAATCTAVYAGLGTRDDHLQPWNQHAGIMVSIRQFSLDDRIVADQAMSSTSSTSR